MCLAPKLCCAAVYTVVARHKRQCSAEQGETEFTGTAYAGKAFTVLYVMHVLCQADTLY